MTGRLHVYDPDNMTSYQILEEKPRHVTIPGGTSNATTVLVSHGATFKSLVDATRYVTMMNAKLEEED